MLRQEGSGMTEKQQTASESAAEPTKGRKVGDCFRREQTHGWPLQAAVASTTVSLCTQMAALSLVSWGQSFPLLLPFFPQQTFPILFLRTFAILNTKNPTPPFIERAR